MDVERSGATRLFDLPDGWDYRLTDGGVLCCHPEHPARFYDYAGYGAYREISPEAVSVMMPVKPEPHLTPWERKIADKAKRNSKWTENFAATIRKHMRGDEQRDLSSEQKIALLQKQRMLLDAYKSQSFLESEAVRAECLRDAIGIVISELEAAALE